ncbi:MAG: DUF3634 family protein [Candidatus Eisenbacteria bacterium]|nr:DUF3634 family protein [Candidatus Latescibacterota bacterium]MBD3301388.1 DUF3634 family protein [Candidatus Eisenbacteria bacterium]
MTEVLILIAAVVFGVVWLVRRRATGAVLSFRQGELIRARGRIAPRQRRALRDVARLTEVTGEIHVRGDDTLDFSDSIPEADRQSFRNAFLAHD